jgi:hypothetical protein
MQLDLKYDIAKKDGWVIQCGFGEGEGGYIGLPIIHSGYVALLLAMRSMFHHFTSAASNRC